MTYIHRPYFQQKIEKALQRSRVVALVGPRQCGKTTLARQFLPADHGNYFDLEDPISLARLEQPLLALGGLRGLVVIDEVQRRPDLFPLLRVLSDRDPLPARFLVLGSASPELLQQSSESLAGRMEVIEASGFGLDEVPDQANTLWLRGGFPLSYQAANEEDSSVWRQQFIQSFLERDLPQMGLRLPSTALLRFWTMLAHWHGQIWNAAEPARSLGVSESTARRYLDVLTQLYMVRTLPPWFENLSKRQVKAPKLYVRDSGLLHRLLGIQQEQQLLSHPKCGASWEGFAIEQLLRQHQPDEAYFWATHQGAELDLLLFKNGQRLGFEIKRMDAPKLTASMKTALADLRLDALTVVYPGQQSYRLAQGVEVVGLRPQSTPQAINP
jgi:hypothetical protein